MNKKQREAMDCMEELLRYDQTRYGAFMGRAYRDCKQAIECRDKVANAMRTGDMRAWERAHDRDMPEMLSHVARAWVALEVLDLVGRGGSWSEVRDACRLILKNASFRIVKGHGSGWDIERDREWVRWMWEFRDYDDSELTDELREKSAKMAKCVMTFIRGN